MNERSSIVTDDDLWYFDEGTHFQLYQRLGAHPVGNSGSYFAVWAPDAEYVSVIGSFNGWEHQRHPLWPIGRSGIWSAFVREARRGDLYKYFIRSRYRKQEFEKADPLAFFGEIPPKTSSIIWDLDYPWADDQWMDNRRQQRLLESPVTIYEVHLPSWRLNPDQNNRYLTYRELAFELADHVQRMGFTHVELLPVMEHPALDSWGYQVTGYFAPSSRLGVPQDLMFLIDYLHRHRIGVIIDWPPAHFADDDYGLALFDGTHLYDHHDDSQGYHPDWHTRVFNFARNEVCSFLLSAAMFWLDKYHADGLRVDAVSSMIYRDFARLGGDWVRNADGGKENREAVSLLQRLNERIYSSFPGVEMFAEESTDWPCVTRPCHTGGLGFGFKWDIRWAHDMLRYMARDPVYRRYHHDELTFRLLYYARENFVLPLGHDEASHTGQSLLARMSGPDWQKFANLRLLYGYMFAQPGKKLLFMGCEFGQWEPWVHNRSVSWHQIEHPPHAGVARWVKDLNHFYASEPAFYETDCCGSGFEWIDCHDDENSVLSFLRFSKNGQSLILAVLNFTPVIREDFRVGVPRPGLWRELLNSDSAYYWGSNRGNAGGVWTRDEGWHGRPHSIVITLPPLAALIFKHVP